MGDRGPDVRGLSTIDLAPVADLHNEHQKNRVPDLIHDSIIARANPVEFFVALEFHTARRPGIIFQSVQRFDDPTFERFVAQRSKNFAGAGVSVTR